MNYLVGLIFILFCYFLYDQKKKYERFWKYIYAIPGPKGYPLIGSVRGLTSDPGTTITHYIYKF